MPNTIDITGLAKPALLRALYKHAKPHAEKRGVDILTREEAERLTGLTENFDRVHGRAIVADIAGNELDLGPYDLINGEGMGAAAIQDLLSQISA